MGAVTRLHLGAVVVGACLALTALYAHAETWCVPHALIGGTCPKVSSTIQGAVKDAIPGSLVKVGAGSPSERFTVDKRIRLQCLPGAVITDAGLAPSAGALIRYTGEFSSPRLKGCEIAVTNSAIGIAVPHSVSWFTMELVTLHRVGARAGTGLLVDGSGGPNHARRVSIKASVISGFAVGSDWYDAAWINPESKYPSPVIWRNNGVGVRCQNCQGQIFYNKFVGNTIGLHIATIQSMPMGQIDINGNVFGTQGVPADANQTAIRFDRCAAWHNELNHSSIFESPVAFLVETETGFVTGDTAYRQAVVRFAQFADTQICRGGVCVTYDSAAFSPTPSPACFVGVVVP